MGVGGEEEKGWWWKEDERLMNGVPSRQSVAEAPQASCGKARAGRFALFPSEGDDDNRRLFATRPLQSDAAFTFCLTALTNRDMLGIN